MLLFLIAGKALHGKDATARAIRHVYEAIGLKVERYAHADCVKDVAVKKYNWDENKDESGRKLLIDIGEEYRAKDPYVWIKMVSEAIEKRNKGIPVEIAQFCEEPFPRYNKKPDVIVIPDCRFKNEIIYYQNNLPNSIHIITVRVTRDNFNNGLTEEQKSDITETELDDFIFEHYIFNNGTVNDLESEVKKLVSIHT